MSGTSCGTCILHVAPEAFIGGPLALIETGDMISLDVPNRGLDVEVSDTDSDPSSPSTLRVNAENESVTRSQIMQSFSTK